MQSQMYSPPTIPIDLERKIFEMTATLHKGTALNLMLVSYRAKIWIERILYRCLIFSSFSPSFRSFIKNALKSRPNTFFADRVKTLYLSSDISFANASLLISICTGVTDLGCWIQPPARPGRASPLLLLGPDTQLRPTRMSIKIETLLDMTTPTESSSEISPPTTPDFTHPIFQNLTHLEIVNPPPSVSHTSTLTLLPSIFLRGTQHQLWLPDLIGDNDIAGRALEIDWTALHHIPNLTHLALGQLSTPQHQHIVHALPSLLSQSSFPTLKVLIVITTSPSIIHVVDKLSEEDHRLVRLDNFYPRNQGNVMDFWEDLRMGCPSGLWGYAEEMVEARRRRQRMVLESS